MPRVLIAVVLLCAVPRTASTQVVLTLEDVLARARSQSAPVVVERARLAEVAAWRADAGRRAHNPVLDVAAGPRRASGGVRADLDIGVSQQLDVSGQRRARVDAAEAALARATASADDVARAAAYRGAAAFLHAVAATEHARIAEDADAVAQELATATERRFAAGDVAAIELNLSRIARARVAADLRAARARLIAAIGELRVLLRIPQTESIAVRGTLDVSPLPTTARLAETVGQRPDLAALDAEGREAEADLALARTRRRPELGLRAGFERDDGDTVVVGGLTLTLPAFQRGDSATAAALARRSRARIERDLAHETAVSEAAVAASVHVAQTEAVEALTVQALPAIADNDLLARRSYEAGELGLLDLLRIRRDAFETREAWLDLRLEAALSRLAVDYQSGALR